MGSIHILPNFEVKVGGETSLRVVTREFLRQRGFSPSTGFGFSAEQGARYGGKKLKLYKVFKLERGVDDAYDANGATRRLSFSPDGDDTYRWNEYMFQEYWDAIDNAGPARVATPKPATKPTPKPAPKPTPATQKPTVAPVPKKRKSNSMLKMLLLLNMLNQKPAPASATAGAKAGKAESAT